MTRTKSRYLAEPIYEFKEMATCDLESPAHIMGDSDPTLAYLHES